MRDLDGRLRQVSNTKENYWTCLRLHVRPAFGHYTPAEVTTGRVGCFLAKQAKVPASQAKQTRTLLNMLFGYALRNDAITRNPVEGTSHLRRTGESTDAAAAVADRTQQNVAAGRFRAASGARTSAG